MKSKAVKTEHARCPNCHSEDVEWYGDRTTICNGCGLVAPDKAFMPHLQRKTVSAVLQTNELQPLSDGVACKVHGKGAEK